MKTIIIMLLLMFSSNLSALTAQEKKDIHNALGIVVALEKGQDKMELLLYKQLDVFKKNGKTYKTIDLHLKLSIDSNIYFRRLKLNLQLDQQQTKFNPWPYGVAVLAGVVIGFIITK